MWSFLRRHPLVVGWIAGLATFGAALAAVGGWVLLGGFDTTAATPHLRAVGWSAHVAMENSVHLRARDVEAPDSFTPAQVAAGGRLYGAHCAACHGGPGLARERWVKGMIPTPPYLIDAPRQWSPAELHELIGDGVKMTGMPAWRETLSEEQVWSLVAFVHRLPGLTSGQFHRMIAAPPEASGPP